MITVAEYPQIRIYWHDDDRSILVGEVAHGWEWKHGHQALTTLNDTVRVWSETRPVYVILHFKEDAHKFPKGQSSITNMQKALSDDPNEEILTIIVAHANILGNMIKIATRIYQLADNESKYRYVATLDTALEIIKSHKANSR